MGMITALTDRINRCCLQLEVNSLLSNDQRVALLDEIKDLVEKRKRVENAFAVRTVDAGKDE